MTDNGRRSASGIDTRLVAARHDVVQSVVVGVTKESSALPLAGLVPLAGLNPGAPGSGGDTAVVAGPEGQAHRASVQPEAWGVGRGAWGAIIGCALGSVDVDGVAIVEVLSADALADNR